MNNQSDAMIKSKDINASGKLTHLVAASLFNQDCKEVFNAKNGKWIGSLKEGQTLEMLQYEIEQIKEEKPFLDPNQISLF